MSQGPAMGGAEAWVIGPLAVVMEVIRHQDFHDLMKVARQRQPRYSSTSDVVVDSNQARQP